MDGVLADGYVTTDRLTGDQLKAPPRTRFFAIEVKA